MTFDDFNLGKPLLNALSDLDFIQPTPVQARTFAPILSGKDIFGVAQTGTGKTFAYLLPVLKMLTYSEQRQPRVLVLVPTRELVLQVTHEIEKLTKYMSVRHAGVYGGTNINTQKQIVYNGLDILVATPGRLNDLALTGVLRLQSVKQLIIDEADEMLNAGFRPQLMQIMEMLPKRRQNIMFSATLTADVEKLVGDYFFEVAKIEIARHGAPLKNIEQKVFYVPNFHTKFNLLQHLLKQKPEMSKVLVFCNSKKNSDLLFDMLTPDLGDSCGVIHSNKSQNYRFRSVEKFNEGCLRVLISSDIAARGTDVADVSHVVNFEFPIMPEDYIHRIGRTGRIDKFGTAYSFCNENERGLVAAAERLMRIDIPEENLPENVKISDIYLSDERRVLYDKEYLKAPKRTENKAFHQKSEKNKKQNSGSPSKKGKTAAFLQKEKKKAKKRK